ncbi:hypothetical protein OHA72_15005 [Dactylosporangium sp. NBC_01737]|uniref:hypothetical protein n=1 Tax=Dactylosporangium sp. NBC_01737 TaxID=2975959 RepID=UPI002E10CD49|nr:hypothetical protein OHA72_15005 [Dactylosporangium sp. NBC_01737]
MTTSDEPWCPTGGMSVHRAVIDADLTSRYGSGGEIRMIRAVESKPGTTRWDKSMSGWNADYAPAPEQLRRQRSRLLALVGQRLRAGWVGWELARDKWQPVIPVVLVFDGGVQLELAWDAADRLSISWNTIDLGTAFTFVGRPHEWRSSHPHPLAAAAGRVLTGWAVTENPYFTVDVDFTGELPMDLVAGWSMAGLWIEFGDVGLHVFSGADTTYVSDAPEEHYRVTHRQLQEEDAQASGDPTISS